MTVAATPHAKAAEVTRATRAAMAARAAPPAVLGVWEEYVKGRIENLDGTGLELACAECTDAGLDAAVQGQWWIRFGMTAAGPPHEDAQEVIRATSKALAAGADRSAVLGLWQAYVKGRIETLDRKGLELACAECTNAGLDAAAQAEWWI